MEESEIVGMITDLESDRVERKASLSDLDRVSEAICAFANDLPGHRGPGVVAIGVDDHGRPTGLDVDDALLRRLADLRDNGKIYPFPSMTVLTVALGGAVVAVVVVEPSDSPPVKFRGRTWTRVGPRRAVATPEEEVRLAERRRQANLPFDARPVTGASLDDLNLERFANELLPQLVAADVLADNERTTGQQLAGLRLADVSGTPTAAGLLFLGREPLAWLPGAFVQFLRLDGDDLGAPILSEHRLTSPLPDVIRELEETVRAHLDVAVDLSGPDGREVSRPDIPFEAVQQVVRNAVMHRSYEATNAPVRVTWFSDRVEVSSPGGPYGQVDATNFGQPGVTDYRNPTVAAVLAQLGFVQRFGVGLALARARMADNGNPPPELEVTPTFVNVVLRLLP